MKSILTPLQPHKPLLRYFVLAGLAGAATAAIAATQLPAPTVVTPRSGTANLDPQATYLGWSAVPGATSYEWRLLLSGTVIRSATLAADHHWRQVKDLAFGTTYGWRVRAFQGTNAGKWMETVPLFTTVPAPTAAMLLTPINRSREQGVVASGGINVNFTWTPIPGAAEYSLYVGKTPTGPFFATKSKTPSAQVLLELGTAYYWYVKGAALNLTYPPSVTHSFNTITMPPFVNQSPTNNTELTSDQFTTLRCTFTVAPSPGATSYKFRFFALHGIYRIPVTELTSSTANLLVTFTDRPELWGKDVITPQVAKFYWDVIATSPLGQFQSPQTAFYYLGTRITVHQAQRQGGSFLLSWDPVPKDNTPRRDDASLHYQTEILPAYEGVRQTDATTWTFTPTTPHGSAHWRVRVVYDARNLGDKQVHYGAWTPWEYYLNYFGW